MATDELVTCGHGHVGLTVCPTCGGTGHVQAGSGGGGAAAGDARGGSSGGGLRHCPACLGSGLLQPHPLSCTG